MTYPLDNLHSESFSLSEEDLINEIRNPSLDKRSTDDVFPRFRHRHRHDKSSRLVERDAQNEHQPRFRHSEYSRSVDENIEIGTSVLTVEATDEDLNHYGVIQYEIPDSNDFTIDEGGVIYTARRLDYESTAGVYRFHVVAKNPVANDDGTRFVINRENGIILVGSDDIRGKYVYEFKAVATDASGVYATVPVIVNVIDENTNKPIFENCSGYNNFPVLENQTVPQDILM
ncbi:Protocadherin Fat 2, partial [Armadillidium nasatum]